MHARRISFILKQRSAFLKWKNLKGKYFDPYINNIFLVNSLFMTIPNSSAVSKERNAVTKSKSLSRLRSSIDVNGLEIVAVSPAKSPKPYKSFSRSCPSLVGGNYEVRILGFIAFVHLPRSVYWDRFHVGHGRGQ